MLEALSNNPGLMLLLLVAGTALVGGATLWRLRGEWALFQQWRAAGMPTAAAPSSPAPLVDQAPALALDTTPLPGAGQALKNPPADLRPVLAAVQTKGGRYRIPLGWVTGGLATAQLVGDVNHILISGASDAGKDNAVMGMLLTLAAQHGPQAVQFCIVDGKGLDWAGWASKAHTWRLALDPEDIAPAMLAISDERRRRGQVLRAAGVAKWDEYQGGDLPLLVVFISELSLLEDATRASELAAWLNSELSAGRAYGLRFIVATQNASNFSTRWRGQIGLFLAGFQPSRSADEPNTGLTSSDLAELGAIAPSQLPAPPAGAGVFTAVQGRDVVTLRASLLASQHRLWMLAQLPDRPATRPQPTPSETRQSYGKDSGENSRPAAPTGDQAVLLQLLQTGQPLPIETDARSGDVARSNGLNRESVAPAIVGSGSTVLSVSDQPAAPVVAVDLVPADEQARILAAAQHAASRRALSQKLYESTGGQKYRWVQTVCDAAGLLMPAGGAQ